VSEKAAAAVADALIRVVTPKGTAPQARVFGHLVAGKTGTAQKIDRATGNYSHSKHVSSFLGFVPANDPAFVALVVFDEAKTKPGEYYGGLVAAPVFSKIAEKTLRYMNIPATEEKAQGEKGTALAGGPNNLRDE
jgi:cell division protein FtsI (penicillin-binding protein 3)